MTNGPFSISVGSPVHASPLIAPFLSCCSTKVQNIKNYRVPRQPSSVHEPTMPWAEGSSATEAICAVTWIVICTKRSEDGVLRFVLLRLHLYLYI